jgi:uncharacterized membrane protein YfcA
MLDPLTLSYIAFCLFTGGFIKGIVGLGLPLISVPLLSFALPLKTSVALMTGPILLTNLVQIFEGGRAGKAFSRFWPIVVTLVITLALSAQALVLFPENVLYTVLGVMLLVMAALMYFRPSFRVNERQERVIGPLTGIIGGMLGGMTGMYGPPIMVFLGALRLDKDFFVTTVSMLYFSGGLALAIGLLGFEVATWQELGVSAIAMIPVYIGLILGQRLRFGLDQARWSNALLIVYVVTAVSFLARAWF